MPRPTVLVELGNGAGDWIDVSRFADLQRGVTVTRGRQDDRGSVEPSVCSVAFDNSTGRFTPGRQPVNLLSNPSFETTIAPWVGSTNSPTVARVAGTAMYGGYSMRVTSTVPGTMVAVIDWNSRIPVVAGASYAVQAALRVATALSRQALARVWWYDASGIYLGFSNASLVNVTTSYQLSAGAVTAPAGAAYARPHISIGAVAAGEVYYVDGVMFEAGSVASPYTDAVPIRVGTPLRVSVTANGVTRRRFTGEVNAWPIEWAHFEAASRITASDAAARLGRHRLRSVIEETVAPMKPAAYYVLGEPEGSTAAGDSSGLARPPLALADRGAGNGTVEFGSGTGPPTDGHGAPKFTSTATADGRYLATTFVSPIRLSSSLLTVHCVVNVDPPETGASQQSTFVRVARASADYGLQIGTNTSGQLEFFFGAPAITHASNIRDGRTHSITLVLASTGVDINDNPTYVYRLYRDGVQVGTTTLSGKGAFDVSRLFVGGGPGSVLLSGGGVSHVAVWDRALSATEVSSLNVAAMDGFTSDSSDQRIARYAGWARLDPTTLSLETGALPDVAHQDTGGMSVIEAMQAVADAENGLLFIDGTGRLVAQARTHRYSAAVDATLDAAKDQVGDDATFSLDAQRLINVVTAQRPNGAAQRLEDTESINTYGEYPGDVTVLVTTDSEAQLAGFALLNANSEPRPRISETSVDLLTQAATFAATMQSLELGDLIELINLPAAQAPTASSRLFVEGWTETILVGRDEAEWSMKLSTSPAFTVWVLEDPQYGALDSTNQLAY